MREWAISTSRGDVRDWPQFYREVDAVPEEVWSRGGVVRLPCGWSVYPLLWPVPVERLRRTGAV